MLLLFFQPCKFFPTVWSIWNSRVGGQWKFIYPCFLSWHGALQGPSTSPGHFFQNYRETKKLWKIVTDVQWLGAENPVKPLKTTGANVDVALSENNIFCWSLIVKSQHNIIELVSGSKKYLPHFYFRYLAGDIAAATSTLQHVIDNLDPTLAEAHLLMAQIQLHQVWQLTQFFLFPCMSKIIELPGGQSNDPSLG